MLKIVRFLKSFRYASRGLVRVFREEQNLQAQSALAVIALALAAYFRVSPAEWAVLAVLIGLVMVTEILNSAVERMADALRPRLDHYVKEIKDIMAAAVMLASVIALAVGAIIFLPYILKP